MCRFSLLTGNGDPFLWDFGSAALHHRLYAPWLPRQHWLAGMVGLRGSVAPEVGLFKRAAEEIKAILKEQGVAKMPIGLDIAELPMIFALREAGLEVMDGQQTMLDARQIKNVDEIMLLNMSAAMVDGVYQVIAEHLKPAVRECDFAAPWRRAGEFAFANEMEDFALQFGHGLGLALHERTIISRLVSFHQPMEIQEGMVFALETYCPASDGHSAARIEEEVVVTDAGCRVITLFPAEELFIANPY